jgi:hypothetical protein
LRATLIALVLLTLAAGTASAGCPALKLRETGKATTRRLDCHRRAALLGVPVDATCLDKARARLAATFADAEARGGCAVTGDATGVLDRIDDLVDVARAAAPAASSTRRCTGGTLQAVARNATLVLKAYQTLQLRGDYGRLVDARTDGAASLAGGLARARCDDPPDADALAAAVAAFAEDIAGALLCGDGVRQLGEACDGGDDDACPGDCAVDCRCTDAAPSACLAGSGPQVTLSGTRSVPYEPGDLAPATRVDARAATFLGSEANPYPLNVDGGAGVCLAGGKVTGQYDRGATWDWMHDRNNAAVRFENPLLTVDGVRIDNVTDGIRPVGGPFVIRHAWLSYVRDDCLENDHVEGGLVVDSLLDGCYVAVSERPSPDILDGGARGRHAVLTMRDSLVRLQAMPGPPDEPAAVLGHGQFFKWHERSTALALHGNVFLAEQVAESGADSMGVPDGLVSCSDNVMVWLGPGSYPAPLPPCFTVTGDRGVWDAAVAAWKQRHPEVTP